MFILNTIFMGGSHYFEVSEEQSARFCVTVGGPLTETINIHVETTDSGFALGEIKLVTYKVYIYIPLYIYIYIYLHAATFYMHRCCSFSMSSVL